MIECDVKCWRKIESLIAKARGLHIQEILCMQSDILIDQQSSSWNLEQSCLDDNSRNIH